MGRTVLVCAKQAATRDTPIGLLDFVWLFVLLVLLFGDISTEIQGSVPLPVTIVPLVSLLMSRLIEPVWLLVPRLQNLPLEILIQVHVLRSVQQQTSTVILTKQIDFV